MTPRELVFRLVAWFHRDALAADLSEELEAHAELLARDLEHEGMSPNDAQAAARRQLGNTTRHRESSRDAWGFPAVESVAQDLRYAIRGLLHAPGFTVTVVVTLGLGIGANAAMFAVIDRLMFRPFPYMRDPASVHRVYVETTVSRRNTNSVIPYTRYLDLTAAARSFSQHAAVSFGGLALVVAAVGLYGVIGYAIAQRTHELGMRIALGARSSHIVRLVAKEGLEFAAAGAAFGLLIAFIASRWIEPLLYKQSSRDPMVYLGVAATMILVGLGASAMPAWRAIRADPNRALRAD